MQIKSFRWKLYVVSTGVFMIFQYGHASRINDPYAKKIAQVALDAEKSQEESGNLPKPRKSLPNPNSKFTGLKQAGKNSNLSKPQDSSKKEKPLSLETSDKNKSDFPVPPTFKNDEYAIFLDDSYKIFKTKNFEYLELTDSCFKKSKPSCMAYEFSQIKPKKLEMKAPGVNNMSAIHCEEVGGRNLLALDNRHNQYNFCRFDDGSMVNSWSMHYKHFPNTTVR